MEPLTHFLTGACLGRAGFNRRTALATLTMTLAAEAPDIDIIADFKSPVFEFAHHRGFTHSFLGLIPVCAAVVGVVYLLSLLSRKKLIDAPLKPRWGLLFVLAYIAGLTHILLDYTNAYGVRPFWPFSEKWYSWDIVFIADPWLLGLLIGGLVLPSILSLFSGRVERNAVWKRRFAFAALAGVVFVWAARDTEHHHALDVLNAATYQGARPVRASAYPYWWTMTKWYSVAETDNFFATLMVNSKKREIDPTQTQQIFAKPAETPATLAAKQSFLGRVYLDWAAYPLVEQETTADGFLVHFRDLRYGYPELTGRKMLTSAVALDSDLHVTGEYFGTKAKALSQQ